MGVPVSLLSALCLLVLAVFAFAAGRRAAIGLAHDAGARLHSQPVYHGAYWTLSAAGGPLALLALYAVIGDAVVDALTARVMTEPLESVSREQTQLFLRDARAIARGAPDLASEVTPAREAGASALRSVDRAVSVAVAIAMAAWALGGFLRARGRLRRAFPARTRVEAVARGALALCSAVAVITTVGIVLSLAFESARFFMRVSPLEFFFGLDWDPQTSIRADQVGAAGAFGVVPLLYGTMFITTIALAVAAPIGLFAAIYLSEYASPRRRAVMKPALEVLAGVPTVVYGFFALLTLGPFIRQAAALAGVDAPAQTALAAGLVMGIMIVPFISSLSDDVINAIPQTLRDGSYALGATPSETVRQVVLPAALPGIMGAVLLAVSRAAGETMIVVMAAGLADAITVNPLASVTTMTVQIVNLLAGDQEFDSAKTLSAFAIGLTLFAVTLALNIIALTIVRRYRERYE